MLHQFSLRTFAGEDGGHLDRYLDALAVVIQRHGLSRARVQDVADELGINRVTVYRQAGSVRDMVPLLFARELGRALPDTLAWAEAEDPVSELIELLAKLAAVGRNHPVLAKVVTDEPQLLGPFLVRQLPAILAQSSEIGAELFRVAIERGKIERRDPKRLGDWIARILLTAVISPPDGDLREFFAEGLRPLLQPRRDT